jgi:sortase (surface protein transpeptidase)
VAVRSGLRSQQAPFHTAAIPRRLRIGTIGVDAPVVPVGVEGGITQIPVDVDEVGWYRFAARPGEAGSTLLVAHVASGAQGPGAFFDLRQLTPGDEVIVEARDGSSAT